MKQDYLDELCDPKLPFSIQKAAKKLHEAVMQNLDLDELERRYNRAEKERKMKEQQKENSSTSSSSEEEVQPVKMTQQSDDNTEDTAHELTEDQEEKARVRSAMRSSFMTMSVSEQMLSDDEPLEMKVEKSKGAILGQLASSIAYARK